MKGEEMLRVLLLMSFILGCFACSGAKAFPSEAAARQEVVRLVKLYTDKRPKYVLAMQSLEQAENCDRVLAIRDTSRKMDAQGAIADDLSQALTVVSLQMATSAKRCLAKD
tara:strand:+ start:943 stop:1275 length:333 start_codon:yes stop_codon:yes gene_type:complete